MSFRKKKNIDRLSSCPNDVVSHILSLMPTKYAVQTCILSKRWRYSWMSVTNLDFDDNHSVNKNQLSEFVNCVLEQCETSQVEKFGLHFSKFDVHRSTVSKWIKEAIRLQVCELDLKVNKIQLPVSLFTCNTLTRFRLHFTHRSNCFWDCPSSINLPCLKTLDIIVGSKPYDNAFKIIKGCPVLETLYLEIKFRDNVEDYNFKIPTLKQLKLSILKSIFCINKIVLDVPNLIYLCVKGSLNSIFVREDLSSLIEAKVSCEVKSGVLWLSLLESISRVKYLSLTIRYWRAKHFLLPMFLNVKHLKLKKGYGSGISWLVLREILHKVCSDLKHLCIVKPYQLGCWKEPDSLPTCMFTNLKTVTFKETSGHSFDTAFLKFLLSNSKVLKILKVTWDTMFSHDEKRLYANLLMHPRASKNCQIHLVGGPPSSRIKLIL